MPLGRGYKAVTRQLIEIATVSLRLNLDLEGKIDFSQEDKEVMDYRLLKHYSALDFLRLFFLSVLS